MGVCVAGVGGRAALSKHRLSTWHLFWNIEVQRRKSRAVLPPNDRPSWSPPWHLKGLLAVYFSTVPDTLLKWQGLDIARVGEVCRWETQ